MINDTLLPLQEFFNDLTYFFLNGDAENNKENTLVIV